jgi:GT2 family glycosyltransferase
VSSEGGTESQAVEGLVTVIVVTWNSRKWLERCLDSVLAQSYAQVETIVVDNASTDGTVAYLHECYPSVRVVESTVNGGFAHGNNLGIAAARGDQIMLLNTDAWLEPDAITTLLRERRLRELDVIGPREVDYGGATGRAPYSSHIDAWGHPVFRALDRRGKRPSFYISGVCLMFDLKLYQETGGLDPAYFMYCEEVDWFWRLQLLGKRFDYSDCVVVHHAGMGSGGTGIDAQRFLWRNQNTLQMLLTNYQLTTLAWVLPTYAAGSLFETLAFAAIGRRDIASTYPRGWWLAFKDLPAIFVKRRHVQSVRARSDREVRATMYIGIGKLHHLRSWLHERR